jgi:putative Mn2+ efflux pump MntP
LDGKSERVKGGPWLDLLKGSFRPIYKEATLPSWKRPLLFKIVAFVIPLGFDTAAVAVLLGLRGIHPLKPALTFAVFEAVMPLIGLWLGRAIGARYEAIAPVLGGLILLGVAGHLLKEVLAAEDERADLSFTTMRTAALAGLGISMDELAVGFPMGTSGLPIARTIAAIAVQTFVVTYFGILIGKRLGAKLGRTTSRIAGLVAAAAFAVLGAYLIAQGFAPWLPEI